MRLRLLLAFSLFMVVASPFSAHAQIISLECDGKMPCTLEQFKKGAAEWYAKADTNHDGVVDAAEQGAFWNKYLKTILPHCHDVQDLNVLQMNKPPSDPQMEKTFNQADVNHDGKIDDAEDKTATARLDQMCALLNDPQMQKIRDLMKQMQNRGLNNPAPKPAQ